MENRSEIPFLRTRLSVQMFLQFAIWGSWAPVLFKHLLNIGFSSGEAGIIMGTGPLAIMISPLIAGQIADRWFPTQRFLAFAYVGTGALLWKASLIKGPDSQMWWLSLAAMLLFGPTLGLSNALCFHHLKDARADFPLIRVWGTLGWIASAWTVTQVMTWGKLDLSACLMVGSIFAVVNGFYCLTLPNTPPNREKRDQFAIAKILKMFGDTSFALFSVLAFFLLAFATFYYFKTAEFFPTLGIPDAWLGPTQTIGQVAEILTMIILPFAYKALGTKKTIAIGLLAWAVRFGVFSLGRPAWLVIASQSLHGVCFAFAIAAAMIYFERICEPDVRATMQSFLSWITYGLGMFVGAMGMGSVANAYSTPDPAHPGKTILDWNGFWSVPAIGCAVILVIFLIGFRARDEEKEVPAELKAEALPVA